MWLIQKSQKCIDNRKIIMKSINNIEKTITKMTLEEKAAFVSGKNFWESKDFEKYGIKSHMLTDGPHGLRKQSGDSDHLGINLSDTAVCFPTASATACSFDPKLLEKMGEALGDKCIRENVSVILGPGVNMKRSPLCGRNFEYFSEDPLLAGEMAAGLVNGIQSKKIGASVKHFAANNQEYARMVNDSNVDERALREIYLPAFEIAVKKSQPYTVMCSYNKINGVYSSRNKWLLTDVLRNEWGFKGLVVTDWGALENPVEAIKAGCDLEMPSSGDENAKKIVEAIKQGKLKEADLNSSVKRMLELCLKTQDKLESTSSDEKDHELARKVACESAVLLKNENNILPLKNNEEVLIVGNMAIKPRYQGAGSSKIVVTKLDSIYDSAIAQSKNVKFVQGYDDLNANDELISEAVEAAKQCDKVIVVCGLPDEYEGEGYDRNYFNMPESHIKLIKEISKVNSNIIAVLQGGSPFDLGWQDKVDGILLTYLSGQAGGSATVDLLWGKVNPSGKLAETWPKKIKDCPASKYYPGKVKAVEYRESIYVGYRYYNTANVDVYYPFGYGLSYTNFAYDNLEIINKNDDIYEVSLDVTNTGKVAGKEIVQLYISMKNSKIFRASLELKAFSKVSLKPRETKKVTLVFNKDAFRYYNTEANKFAIEGGDYEVLIGKSSKDIVLKSNIKVTGDGLEKLLLDKYSKLTDYYNPSVPFKADKRQFEILLGHKASEGEFDKKGEFSDSSCLEDLRSTFIGKVLYNFVSKSPLKVLEDNADEGMKNNASSMLLTIPLRAITMSGRISKKQVDGIVDIANGHFFRGLIKLRSKNK